LHDRLLSARSRTRHGAALGRVFGVTRQSWALTDDPRVTAPALEPLATGRSAAEAADLARDAATAYASHGFHKPSGAWWATQGGRFHRFVVVADRPRGPLPLLLGVGALALVVAALRGASGRRAAAARQ